MTSVRALLVLVTLTGLFTAGCSQSSTPTNVTQNKKFDYAAFVAATPVDHLNYDEENVFDSADYDPAAANIDEVLSEWDEYYGSLSSITDFAAVGDGCRRATCQVWARVSIAEQRLYLYVDGEHVDTWLVSSGTGNRTPKFDRHPNGRIYNKYSSKTYPGGDYNGLGNMPYAVFIQGGYAIHGTPRSNWSKLGSKASHGCIRVHPDNGYRFNRLVREVGISNTWITVE